MKSHLLLAAAMFAALVGRVLPLSAQTPVQSSRAPERPPALTALDLETWLDGFVPGDLVSGDIDYITIVRSPTGRLYVINSAAHHDEVAA